MTEDEDELKKRGGEVSVLAAERKTVSQEQTLKLKENHKGFNFRWVFIFLQ